MESADGSANVVVAVSAGVVVRLTVDGLLFDARCSVLIARKTSVASYNPLQALLLTRPPSRVRHHTLFAITFAVVLRLEVVSIAAVSLVLELAAFAGDRVVVPVVKRRATTGRSVTFVGRLDARKCCNKPMTHPKRYRALPLDGQQKLIGVPVVQSS